MKRWQDLMKVDIQPCYKHLTQKFLSLSSTADIMFDSGSQKSYITADLTKKTTSENYSQ